MNRSWLRRHRREMTVLALYLLFLGGLALRVPGFFKGDQLRALSVSTASVLIAAIGMTMVMITRQIDISIGSQFSVCGVVAGLLARAGMPLPVVGLGVLVSGALMGAFNGVLIAALGLPSIVVTLATLVILRESLRWTREGEFVRNLPEGFQWFGLGQTNGQWVVIGVAIGLTIVFAWGLRNLGAGRAIYATGSDPEAARLVGIRPRSVTFQVFVAMGALAGLAAWVNAIRFVDVDPNSGAGLELQAIAAVVVGGVAVSGGRGTLLGTFIGVLLLGSIGPALVFLGIQPQWEKAIQGMIILLAVASDSFNKEGR